MRLNESYWKRLSGNCTLSAIKTASGPSGYIAVIAADGLVLILCTPAASQKQEGEKGCVPHCDGAAADHRLSASLFMDFLGGGGGGGCGGGGGGGGGRVSRR